MRGERADAREHLGRATRWLLIAGTVSVVVAAASITVAALLVRDIQPNSLEELANVGQAFGALSAVVSAAALVALIFTFAAQQHEMREQRVELKLQAEALRLQAESLAHSRLELRCTAEVGLSMHHLEVLRMAIEYQHLAEVWPTFEDGLTARANQQFLYCNLILDGIWLQERTGRLTESGVRAAITYLATSPTFRAYWRISRNNREATTSTDGPEASYFRIIDDLFGGDS